MTKRGRVKLLVGISHVIRSAREGMQDAENTAAWSRRIYRASRYLILAEEEVARVTEKERGGKKS